MKRTHALRSAWIAGTAALALILTACGSSSDTGSGSVSVGGGAAATAVSGDVSGTIEYWLWDSNQLPAYEDCATAFSQKYPNAKVNITQYGWDDYWAKITNGFTSGTGPDVFTNHLSKYPEFVNKQYILNLSDALKADGADKDIYQPGLLSLWTAQDGGIYGLPKDFDTIGLFYNEDMVKAAGYTDEDLQTLTWNTTDGGSFEKFVAHMTIDANGVRGDEPGFDKENVKTYGFGQENVTDGNGQTQWSPFTGSNGWTYTDKNPWGTQFNYGDDKFNEALTFYKSLSEKGYSPTLDKTVGVDTGAQLGAGTFATVFEGDWNTSSFMNKGVSEDRTHPDRPERAACFDVQRSGRLRERRYQEPGRRGQVGRVHRFPGMPGSRRGQGGRVSRHPGLHRQGRSRFQGQGCRHVRLPGPGEGQDHVPVPDHRPRRRRHRDHGSGPAGVHERPGRRVLVQGRQRPGERPVPVTISRTPRAA